MLEIPYNMEKEIIPLTLNWHSDKTLDPTCLFLEHGGIYQVDRAHYDGLYASWVSGGFGHRYTVRSSCEVNGEMVYGKMWLLYLELYGVIGRWYCEDINIDMVSVRWEQGGFILPVSFRVDRDYTYEITKLNEYYPMSSRKSDGAGMRYIVTASCRELRDVNRMFPLMLENGGEYVGSWFVEDYDISQKAKQIISMKEYR